MAEGREAVKVIRQCETQAENSGQEVEESMWSRYPEELHMAILKRLPWMDKIRLRQVCVLWNSILRDPCLLKSSLSPSSPAAHFCCLNPSDRGGEFQLYSPIGKSWQKFSSAGTIKVIAAAAGLLLMQCCTGGRRTLILLNPLNRSQRILRLHPEFEDVELPQSLVFEMTLDTKLDAVRILAGVRHVTSDDNVGYPHFRNWHTWKFFVYDLGSNTWEVVADLRLRDEGYPVCTLAEQLPSVTLVGKDLFFLSTFHGTSSHLYKISQPPTSAPPSQPLVLGVEQDLVVGGTPLPTSSTYVDSTLFQSSGRLLLVLRHRFRIGKAEDFEHSVWEVSVYEFDFSSSGWKEALTLPRDLARSRSFVSVDIDGGLMCFHNDDVTGICDLASQMWTTLPRPVYHKCGHELGARMFLFEPRLDIIL